MKSNNQRYIRVKKEQRQAFYKAVQHNELNESKCMLQDLKKSLPDKVNIINSIILEKSGDSVLHVCARNGYLDMMRYFVEEEGANLELINFDGKTALHDAAQFCQPDIVKYLLSKGANVNVVKKADWTPLMLACTKPDNLTVVQALLNGGASLNFVNKDGWTCVHIAAREGNVEVLECLLNSCDITQKNWLIDAKSKNGRKAIHTAVMHGNADSVKLLTRNQSGNDINCEDNCGTTPIMDACRCGFKNIIEFFVNEKYVDPTSCNKNGVGLLHIAAEANQSEMIEYLVKNYGLDVNKPSTLLGFTPLHWASREGNVSAVNTLLKLGANLKMTDDKGQTAKDIAQHFQKECIYNIILEYEQETKK